MPNHPNRSRARSPARNPAPDEVRTAREAAGLSQSAAAELIHSTLRTWQDWEAAKARMHPGLWDLFRILTEAEYRATRLEARGGVTGSSACQRLPPPPTSAGNALVTRSMPILAEGGDVASSLIELSTNRVWVLLRGPFPRAVADAAAAGTTFSDPPALLLWLDREWPEWRSHLVKSNLDMVHPARLV